MGDVALMAQQGARIVTRCRGINKVKQNDTPCHGDTVRFFIDERMQCEF
jgi:hypothetical protein